MDLFYFLCRRSECNNKELRNLICATRTATTSDISITWVIVNSCPSRNLISSNRFSIIKRSSNSCAIRTKDHREKRDICTLHWTTKNRMVERKSICKVSQDSRFRIPLIRCFCSRSIPCDLLACFVYTSSEWINAFALHEILHGCVLEGNIVGIREIPARTSCVVHEHGMRGCDVHWRITELFCLRVQSDSSNQG